MTFKLEERVSFVSYRDNREEPIRGSGTIVGFIKGNPPFPSQYIVLLDEQIEGQRAIALWDCCLKPLP